MTASRDIADQSSLAVLRECARRSIAFVPFFSLGAGAGRANSGVSRPASPLRGQAFGRHPRADRTRLGPRSHSKPAGDPRHLVAPPSRREPRRNPGPLGRAGTPRTERRPGHVRISRTVPWLAQPRPLSRRGTGANPGDRKAPAPGEEDRWILGYRFWDTAGVENGGPTVLVERRATGARESCRKALWGPSGSQDLAFVGKIRWPWPAVRVREMVQTITAPSPCETQPTSACRPDPPVRSRPDRTQPRLPRQKASLICRQSHSGDNLARDYRWTRGEAPSVSRSTSSNVAIEVSPGVVIARAPCATPYASASSAERSFKSP